MEAQLRKSLKSMDLYAADLISKSRILKMIYMQCAIAIERCGQSSDPS